MIVDIIFGFLGSGKTTFITRVLKEWGGKEKLVVLVNEFGEVGIDGALLKEHGGNVVEMPSGCICCTLQADFRSQMLDIIRTIRPERVIIEPTGVATITQIRSIIQAQLFEDVIDEVRNVLVADATGFMGLYRANSHFVESQVRNARVVLLNKCDRVERRRAVLTRDAISAINPDVTVLMTEFGAVDWAQYQLALSTSLGSGGRSEGAGLSAGPRQGNHLQPPEGLIPEGTISRPIHLHDEEDALGYESLGRIYRDVSFDVKALEDLFQTLKSPEMGEVVRAKGIFHLGNKSILIELASGELSSQPVKPSGESRVSIIGRNLDRKAIEAAIERCKRPVNG